MATSRLRRGPLRGRTDAVATITMNRPEVANAQNTQLIDELDAAFDRADADDAVRVVILAGAGQALLLGPRPQGASSATARRTSGCQMRETPEGKFHHEKIMYYDRCLRIHDFRKPTIAAVQGSCVAAGLMLACMCDLIVAADDAKFSNPVLRMTGAGVELLVEPWELGIRKAKEFLSPATPSTPRRPGASGWSTGWCPGPSSRRGPRSWPTRSRWCPPVTAQTVKDTINHTADAHGQAGCARSTTSWPTTGCTTRPPRSTPWRRARTRAP